jgi:hypothetical protein
MAEFQYADPGTPADPLEEAQRIKGQFTTSRATQTLGDYSYRNPQHPLQHGTPAARFLPHPGGGTSGGWATGGGGAGGATGGGRDTSSPQFDPRWEESYRDGEEDGEDGGTAGTTTSNGGPGGGYSPWGTHQPDFNDQPVPKVQGTSAGEPVTSGPSPYL